MTVDQRGKWLDERSIPLTTDYDGSLYSAVMASLCSTVMSLCSAVMSLCRATGSRYSAVDSSIVRWVVSTAWPLYSGTATLYQYRDTVISNSGARVSQTCDQRCTEKETNNR